LKVHQCSYDKKNEKDVTKRCPIIPVISSSELRSLMEQNQPLTVQKMAILIPIKSWRVLLFYTNATAFTQQ
jgi:hypothetical protein